MTDRKRAPVPTRRPPVPGASRKHQYSVIFSCVPEDVPAFAMGGRYFFDYNKHYGNVSSYGGSTDTIEAALAIFAGMKQGWEGFDGILDRDGDPVTARNLYFEDRTGLGITIEQLLSCGQGYQRRLL